MNKLFLFIFLLIINVNSVNSETMGVKKTVLPNGIVIITKTVNTNRIVSVVVSAKMGSLYETDENAGLCNLLQDTILKGTKTRSSEQIALELESMGTRLSASAEREYGTVEMQSTSESLYKSFEILYDILLNATFPDDAINLQKNLQIQSIMMRYDQPIYRAMDLMVDAHFGKHPFHKPSLGYPESIKKITRENLQEIYKKIYVPGNMIISVVGNFDEKELIKNIKENLGSLKGENKLEKVSYDKTSEQSGSDNAEKIEKRDTAANWFAIGWSAPTMKDKDFYAMEVLNSITGGSMNSRLFIAIREKRGLAYQVSSFYNPRVEAGIFVAYIGTKPESYEESKKVLLDEIQKMGKEKATDEEITFSKNYLKGMNIMSQESNAGQASLFGHYELLGLGYDFVDKYNKSIDKITSDDVLETGKKYLLKNYALGAVLTK